MGIKCCYGCVPPKRHTACWGHCPDYAKEKAQNEKDTAAQRKQKEIQAGITSQKYDGVFRACKRRGKR
jgi:hypothetical protein